MHAYFRNHTLYLAERNAWLDRHVVKQSKRAQMKVDALKEYVRSGSQVHMISKTMDLIYETMLKPVPAKTILNLEKFYEYNLDN